MRKVASLVLAATLLLTACTGTDEESTATKPTPTKSQSQAPSPTGPDEVSLAMYGQPEELLAFRRVVNHINASDAGLKVSLLTYDDPEQTLRLAESGHSPDVVMVSRRDLLGLVEAKRTTPVDNLLEERGVDFGDEFNRDAVASFGRDGRLQCMPYSISPMVMYLNTNLIDFDRMQRRGLEVPLETHGSWTLSQFEAAAEFATRPRRQTRGFYIEPSFYGLAPFIYSAGGQIFDDTQDPKSLAFSSDETKAALERVLPVLRSGALTPTNKQLTNTTGLQLFKRGKLGMIAGDRSLVPELRKVPGLEFDVMPMPRIEKSATVGTLSGLCISADSDEQVAADLITALVQTDHMAEVARVGGFVPANSAVAGSPDFLKPNLPPKNAKAFVAALRGMVIAPMLNNSAELTEVEAPFLRRLLMAPGTLDLDALTAEMDEVSRPLLDPEYVPPTASASPAAEDSASSQ